MCCCIALVKILRALSVALQASALPGSAMQSLLGTAEKTAVSIFFLRDASGGFQLPMMVGHKLCLSGAYPQNRLLWVLPAHAQVSSKAYFCPARSRAGPAQPCAALLYHGPALLCPALHCPAKSSQS